MSTETAPTAIDLPSFDDRIANFTGNSHAFLLWLLEHPTLPMTEGMKALGLSHETLYSWRREFDGYAQLVDELRDYQHVLRQKLAKDVLESATVDVARIMVVRAKKLGRDARDAQRATERILETVGVLPKLNADPTQTPIQVTTYTYLLVQPGQEPKPFMVETTAKAMPPPANAPST